MADCVLDKVYLRGCVTGKLYLKSSGFHQIVFAGKLNYS